MSQRLPFPDLTQRMLAAYLDLAAFARGLLTIDSDDEE